jgi:hypothetical protein
MVVLVLRLAPKIFLFSLSNSIQKCVIKYGQNPEDYSYFNNINSSNFLGIIERSARYDGCYDELYSCWTIGTAAMMFPAITPMVLLSLVFVTQN